MSWAQTLLKNTCVCTTLPKYPALRTQEQKLKNDGRNTGHQQRATPLAGNILVSSLNPCWQSGPGRFHNGSRAEEQIWGANSTSVLHPPPE